MVKRIFKLMCAAAACAALFACTKAELREDNSKEAETQKHGQTVTIFASVDEAEESRVSLNETAFSWTAGDEIAIIDYATGNRYKFVARESGATNVAFDGEVPEGTDVSALKLYFAVYPYVDDDRIYAEGKSTANGTYHQVRFAVPTEQTGKLEDAPHRLVCNANANNGKFIFRSGVSYWKFNVPDSLKATKIVFRHETKSATKSRYISGAYQARVTGHEGEDSEVLNICYFSSTTAWVPSSNETVIYRNGEVISGDIYLVLGEMNTAGMDFSVRIETEDSKMAFLRLMNQPVIAAGKLLDGGDLAPTKFYDTEVIEVAMPRTNKNYSGYKNPFFLDGSNAIRTAYTYQNKNLAIVPSANPYSWVLHSTRALACNGTAGVRINSYGSEKSYLKLPVVKGKKLVKIEARFGRTNKLGGTSADSLVKHGNCAITDGLGVVLKDDYGTEVGTALTGTSTKGLAENYTWDLSGGPGSFYKCTSPDSAYRMVVSEANFYSVKCTYIGVEKPRIKSVVTLYSRSYPTGVRFRAKVYATDDHPKLGNANLGFRYKIGSDANWTTCSGSFESGGTEQFQSPTVVFTDAQNAEPFIPVTYQPFVTDQEGTKVYGEAVTFYRVAISFAKDLGLSDVSLAAKAKDTLSFTLKNSFESNREYPVSIVLENANDTAAIAALKVVDSKYITIDKDCQASFHMPGMDAYGAARICAEWWNGSAATQVLPIGCIGRVYYTQSGTVKSYAATRSAGGQGVGNFTQISSSVSQPVYYPTSHKNVNGQPADAAAEHVWTKNAGSVDVNLMTLSMSYE